MCYDITTSSISPVGSLTPPGSMFLRKLLCEFGIRWLLNASPKTSSVFFVKFVFYTNYLLTLGTSVVRRVCGGHFLYMVSGRRRRKGNDFQRINCFNILFNKFQLY